MRLLFLLLLLMTLNSLAIAQVKPTLKPYTARYSVKYRGLNGGDIEFTLRSVGTNQFKFNSHLLPNFLGSLFTSDQAEDTSTFVFEAGTIKPLQFISEDGSKHTENDINYEFDISSSQVRARYQDRDFTMLVPQGVQDRLSIQLSASLALQAGRDPGKLVMLEKDELQEYTITRQGTEHIKTAAGEFDTVVLKSLRKDSDKITRYWYASSLGFIPARAERTSKGKTDIVMELKSIQFQ